MPTIPVTLNPNVQPGARTRDEVIAAVQDQGYTVKAADIKIDADTGLLHLQLNISTSVHPQTAIDAINANPGVAQVGPAPVLMSVGTYKGLVKQEKIEKKKKDLGTDRFADLDLD